LPFSFSFLPPGLLVECMPNFSVGPYFLFWSVSENEAKEFACLNFWAFVVTIVISVGRMFSSRRLGICGSGLGRF
jgi:hypothetical protein